MPTTKRFLIGWVLSLLVAAGVFAWMRVPFEADPAETNQSSMLPAPDDHDEYIGTDRCADCHQEIVESYRTHPMSRSAAPVRDVPRPELAAAFGADRVRYSVEQVGDRFLHHEIVHDEAGNEVVRHTMPVSFEIGSGQRGKSYVANDGGLLSQSPFTWYPQTQTWDLSPGYESDKANRFERRVGERCLFCHVGRVNTESRELVDNFAAHNPIAEFGIGCERCHGPGQKHAELYESGGPDDSQLTQIVNPAALDRLERDAVCYQCHLSAIRVVRNGRHDFDFRPGQPLDSVWAVFLGNKGDARMDGDSVVSHVRQMESSACFVGSDGELSCTSCHDPHRSPSAAEQVNFYRDRCLKCHGTEDSECALPMATRSEQGNSCIVCHMPSRESSDVAHVAQSNHRIPRFADEPPAPSDSVTGQVELFRPADSRLSATELERGRAVAIANVGLTANAPAILSEAEQLLKRTAANDPDDVEVRLRLAKIYYLVQQLPVAREHLEAALQVAPQNETLLTLVGVVCQGVGDFDAGLKYFDRLLKVNPRQSQVYLRRSGMQAAFGDLAGAIESAKTGLEIDATATTLRSELARYLEASNDAKAAAEQKAIVDGILRARE